MTDIFISYSHKDEERVKPIIEKLEKRGRSVFWDRHIPAAQTWHNYIGEALNTSSCVLVVWSRHSIISESVIEEAVIAKKRGVLVPLRIDDIDPPLGFSLIQSPNLADWKNNSAHPAFQLLVDAIETKLSSSTPQTITSTKTSAPELVLERNEVPAPAPVLPSLKPERQLKVSGYKSLLAQIPKQQAVIAVAALMVVILVVMLVMSNKHKQFPVESAVPVIPAASLAPLSNFVLIRGGEFMMGSPSTEPNRSPDEGPQHQVRLSDFYMGKYEVTVAEFRKFVEANAYLTDAEKGGDSKNWRHDVSGNMRIQAEENHPVIRVSWNDAKAYCDWMSKQTGKKFRLPTEAEWEYACRAGSTMPFNTGKNLTTDQANYDGNYPYNNNPKGQYRSNTVPVESFAPNAWGLYNMHGNVWEWCRDWYGEKYYKECKAKGVAENPENTAPTSARVLRGGSWIYHAEYCRSANRYRRSPDARDDDFGFRLVFVP
ncbi:MAG: TIR domain-containing protein [Chlorobium sp.]|nr:MAG: TIR domain-containing protein [Chlorobium sp.]